MEPAPEISYTEEADYPTTANDEVNLQVGGSGVGSKECKTYTTAEKATVTIDDSKQIGSSSGAFHSKYIVERDIFESRQTVVFKGKTKSSQTNVAIKRFKVTNYKDYLMENVPEEAFHQKIAEQVNIRNGKASVLKMLDWFIYDEYFVFVTEYDRDFIDLFDCTFYSRKRLFSENESKIIFKLLFELVGELHKIGIFHLDIKPENFLYNYKKHQIKLIDFGHARRGDPGKNLKIGGTSGTNGIRSPLQARKEEFYGKDADLWGIGQTLFFCLQGDYAFQDDSEVINVELKFKVEVGENCKDLITRMLAKNVEDRITPQEILSHPWLTEN